MIDQIRQAIWCCICLGKALFVTYLGDCRRFRRSVILAVFRLRYYVTFRFHVIQDGKNSIYMHIHVIQSGVDKTLWQPNFARLDHRKLRGA